MCGRFTLSASVQALKDCFPLFDLPEVPPRYNIAPTQPVLAIRRLADAPRPEGLLLRWGLVPHWADDPQIGYRLINARAETAASKPAFRASFRQRRCLVLADGFYEWKNQNGIKQPFYFHRPDRKPFAFAGLWDQWDRQGEGIVSCTILTTQANQLMRPIHDRMPALLDRPAFDRWLDPGKQQPAQVQELLAPCPEDFLTAVPVSTYVNNPRHEGSACIAPVG